MVAFYLTLAIILFMIWYAGYEGTMRVFIYFDLQLRYLGVKFRMWQMKRQLEKQLGLPPTKFSTVLEELKNEQ